MRFKGDILTQLFEWLRQKACSTILNQYRVSRLAYKHFLAQCEEIEVKKAAEPSPSSQNDFKSEVIETPDLSKSCPVKTNPDESLALNAFNITSQATSSQESITFKILFILGSC